MTGSPRTGAPRPESSTFAQDALDFTRLGGAEAIAFFQADDEQGAARALLRNSPVPVAEQKPGTLAPRVEECSQALPDQGIPGYSESIRATAVLRYVFLAAVALAALWAVVLFFIGDPNAEPLVFPAKSPYFEIATAWEGLQNAAGAVVVMDLFLTVFLFAVRRSDESIGLFLLPALCALPFVAIYLLSRRRLLVAKRRHALVADRLFRLPGHLEMSLPESVSLEGLEYPADGTKTPARRSEDEAEDEAGEVDRETSFEDTEWTTSFSSRATPSDHRASRDRQRHHEE